MFASELSFSDYGQRNPCYSCPAPCCRLQLIPYGAPTTFMHLDFIRYMLLFPNTEVIVSRNGNWNIVKWEDCREFDITTQKCKLHNSPIKPRTCAMYNPYNCWYKKIFVLQGSEEVYRINIERFNIWINEIRFDEDGQIVEAPDFERSLEVLKNIPIEPCFKPLEGDNLVSDLRLTDVRA